MFITNLRMFYEAFNFYFFKKSKMVIIKNSKNDLETITKILKLKSQSN